MARVTNGILGSASGRVGKHVYRNIRGKNFVSIRPESYNICNSDKSIANRKKFGLTSSFAKFIANNDALKQIWKQNSRDKSYTYNKIIKANAAFTKEQTLTPVNRIVPDNQLTLIKNFSFGEGIIKEDIITEIANTLFSPIEPVTFIFIFFIKNNPKEKEDEFAFSLMFLEIFAGDMPEKISLPVTEELFSLLRKSISGVIYNTIIQKQNAKYRWSTTSSVEF
ncbi:MAG: hypothetical protein COZ80_04975 [Ignavibacteria bacterium CG_4_8_14_3_um_filter_37_9]|nr:MAG: hypothetical protein COZ80_04975 [Ignavibacteria bacterium CG_4_8_14_3_um_filter_37_9]